MKRWSLLLLLLTAAELHAGDPFRGRELYQQHCATCHGSDGRGAQLGVPDFSRGQGLMINDLQLVETLKIGKGIMPAYQGMLSDQQLGDTVSYIRTLF